SDLFSGFGLWFASENHFVDNVKRLFEIRTLDGGPAWRQTTFHPFATTSRLARGSALRLDVEAPVYATAAHGDAPLVAAAASHDAASGAFAVFLQHRGLAEPVVVEIELPDAAAGAAVDASGIWNADRFAVNTLEDPERVRPRPLATGMRGNALRLELPPIAWAAVRIGPAA
ncbi:MAG: hypothetical protein J7480_00490, partial [Microbacteriaceae bacterium]|nr:hypothetical protein [Microbacteriaceae bacterium]